MNLAEGPVRRRGGPTLVRREQAPLGRLLPYRRAHGEPPPPQAGIDTLRTNGWRVDFGSRGLGDLLLGLAMAQALHEATHEQFGRLEYIGSRGDLIARCTLPVAVAHGNGHQLGTTGGNKERGFHAVPESPPTLLDLVRADIVEVHAALPMRYYLGIEQTLGVRLPANSDPCPRFRSTVAAPEPLHVVFVSTTSRPERKDYGIDNFSIIAERLAAHHSGAWRFSLVTPPDREPPQPTAQIEVIHGPPAVDCVDLFATAELVIGNDTGLTHLAALTARPDGSGPHVVGLYGRHGHAKWTTGSPYHHAVATPFSHLMSIADACPVRDGYDDTLWSTASDLRAIPGAVIAEFAGQCAGWWGR
ncbi:glycosyl transferase family 9 [Salinispora arenicola]|uniref:glycosyltransferase family 9 protein n=1 Tax=Salinispora arenicola TaxID=168697 RepID=UPI00142F531D|nr:glycosyltransferase family 9 protein [Salinispora arenicola]NIL43760.1 glycosyl transferase family 9 [Salinispora arenicola]